MGSEMCIRDSPTLDEIHAQEAREKAAAKEVVVDTEAADVLAAAEAGEAISELVDDNAETSSDEPAEASPEEEVPAQEDSSGNLDYESMTVAELKTLLKEAGKPVSGKKAELIERLKE